MPLRQPDPRFTHAATAAYRSRTGRGNRRDGRRYRSNMQFCPEPGPRRELRVEPTGPDGAILSAPEMGTANPPADASGDLGYRPMRSVCRVRGHDRRASCRVSFTTGRRNATPGRTSWPIVPAAEVTVTPGWCTDGAQNRETSASPLCAGTTPLRGRPAVLRISSLGAGRRRCSRELVAIRPDHRAVDGGGSQRMLPAVTGEMARPAATV